MATSPLPDRQKRAKVRFTLSLEVLDRHYASCPKCQAQPEPCRGGALHWDQAALRLVDVVRTCSEWHHTKFQGAERGRVLTAKLRRVVALLVRPPRG